MVDAFFTATSATCVTGLMSVDTMTYFTAKGHWVLLFLIQLGGLNFIAFGSFLAVASKFGVAVKQHEVIEDFVNSDSLLGSSGSLGKVVMWCLGVGSHRRSNPDGPLVAGSAVWALGRASLLLRVSQRVGLQQRGHHPVYRWPCTSVGGPKLVGALGDHSAGVFGGLGHGRHV